ncbi:hypothetical protein BKA80DRAFT_143752 [Phyllosticta citrichinensis]
MGAYPTFLFGISLMVAISLMVTISLMVRPQRTTYRPTRTRMSSLVPTQLIDHRTQQLFTDDADNQASLAPLTMLERHARHEVERCKQAFPAPVVRFPFPPWLISISIQDVSLFACFSWANVTEREGKDQTF